MIALVTLVTLITVITLLLGDDETMTVDLAGLGSNVRAIGLCITSYKENRFSSVAEAYVRVLSDSKEVARYTLHDLGPYTAYIVAMFTRGCEHHPNADHWSMNAVGVPGYGKSVSYTIPAMKDIYNHKSPEGRMTLPAVVRFGHPRGSEKN